MKVSCLRENLSRGLDLTARVASAKTTLPITKNVLFRASNGEIGLTATDLETTMSTRVGAMVHEEGAAAVPAKLLQEFVNSLTAERVDLDIARNSQVLNVQAGNSEANIICLEAGDFPPCPEIDEAEWAASINPEELQSALTRTTFSAAADESRPVLTGLLLKLEQDQFTMASADGFRLSIHTGHLDGGPSESQSVIVPKRTMEELRRLLSKSEEPVRVAIGPEAKYAQFQVQHTDPVEMTSRLLPGSFPNYEELVPTSHAVRAVLDTGAVLAAARTAAIFTRDQVRIVRMKLTPGENSTGKMLVFAKTAELGESEEELDIPVLESEEESKIACDSRYLVEVLTALNHGRVVFKMQNSSSPVVFHPEGSDDYTHVLMPMYVQD